MIAPAAGPPALGAHTSAHLPRRSTYLLLLAWAFGFFNAVRLLTYLPTIVSIHTSGQSDQHSLLTWLAWFGANLTMGLWLHEGACRRLDGATALNVGNALMCLLTSVVICWYR
jgi:hypothetical protein